MDGSTGEEWVVVDGTEAEEGEAGREEEEVHVKVGGGWFGGKQRVKVKGKKAALAKKSSEKKLRFLGREFGAKAPFYIIG